MSSLPGVVTSGAPAPAVRSRRRCPRPRGSRPRRGAGHVAAPGPCSCAADCAPFALDRGGRGGPRRGRRRRDLHGVADARTRPRRSGRPLGPDPRRATASRRAPAKVLVTERGWHPQVPVRTYSGTLEYVAPESLEVSLADTTEYPSKAWHRNDVTIVVDRDREWRSGPAACPASPSRRARRPSHASSVPRPGSPSPTPHPRHSTSSSRSAASPGVDDRSRSASASSTGTTPSGSRSPSPRSHRSSTGSSGVGTGGSSTRPIGSGSGSIDAGLVPLQLEVFAATSRARERWAARRGYTDDPGTPVLEVRLHRVRATARGPRPPARADRRPGAGARLSRALCRAGPRTGSDAPSARHVGLPRGDRRDAERAVGRGALVDGRPRVGQGPDHERVAGRASLRRPRRARFESSRSDRPGSPTSATAGGGSRSTVPAPTSS